MIQRKPNDVFDEIKKQMLVYKSVGLFTSIYSKGEFKTTRYWIISSFFTLWPFLAYNIYILCFEWTINMKSLYSYMGVLQILLVILCLFLMWLANSIKMDSLNKSLREIQVVDHYLCTIDELVPHSKPSMVVTFVILMIISTFFLRLPTYKSYYRCFTAFVMYYPYILMFMVHMLLDRMFTIFFLRYQAVTNALQKCVFLQGKKAAILLEKMVFCYECLSSSGERLNDFFSLQILSFLTAIFIISFSEVYAVINLFYDGEPIMDKKITFISKVCWSFITFLTIWQFGYRFSKISDKAKEFNSLLYRLMIEDKTNIILHSAKLRLHFKIKRDVIFTACGLFKLDCTLIHSMIASASTYLVILIQFGKLTSNGNFIWTPNTSIPYNTTSIPTLFSTSYKDGTGSEKNLKY